MSAIDMFFKLGDKVTKGDPGRQQDFIYYMMWIIVTAFFIMFSSNLYRLIKYHTIDSLIWTALGFAIMVIQYFTLKQMHEMRRIRKQRAPVEEYVEDIDEMLASFEKGKGGKNNNGIRKKKSSSSKRASSTKRRGRNSK